MLNIVYCSLCSSSDSHACAVGPAVLMAGLLGTRISMQCMLLLLCIEQLQGMRRCPVAVLCNVTAPSSASAKVKHPLHIESLQGMRRSPVAVLCIFPAPTPVSAKKKKKNRPPLHRMAPGHAQVTNSMDTIMCLQVICAYHAATDTRTRQRVAVTGSCSIQFIYEYFLNPYDETATSSWIVSALGTQP